MRVTTRLYWNIDHTRIVPKGNSDAVDLFSREGANISSDFVEQYGLMEYVEGHGENVKAKPRRGRER